MTLLEQAAKIPNGVKHINEWLGSGGKIVVPWEAQRRADICLKCPLNQHGSNVIATVALAIKAHLGVKNKLNLKVNGEKKLHTCGACGCVLRLLIWEPIESVMSQMTPEEKTNTPEHCWKHNK